MEIQDVIIWILFVISIIVFFWFVFGNSPTLEQALLIFILTVVFANSVKISSSSMRLTFLEKGFIKLNESHIRLAKDFKAHLVKHHEKKR
jgi:hypothetical protein